MMFFDDSAGRAGRQGLSALEMLCRLHGIDLDTSMFDDGPVDGDALGAMMHVARKAGLATQLVQADWSRLQVLPLPGIAALRDGGFVLLGKVNTMQAIVLATDAERPSLLSQAEFEAIWGGQVLLVKKQGAFTRTLTRAPTLLAQAVRQLTGGIGTVAHVMRTWTTGRQAAQKAGTALVSLATRTRELGEAISMAQRDRDRRTQELAFLPAALEIVEKPPSPLGRATAFTIIGIFSATLLWAIIGSVDIVAVAPGKVVAAGNNKIIQPFDTSVVRAIRVQDGQRVKTGDVLIELDATMSMAEFERLKSDHLSALLDAARLQAALVADDPLSAFTPPKEAPSALVEMHRRLLTSQITEQNAKLAAIDRQIAQKDAERATIEAAIDKLKATIAPLQQRVDIREQLFRKEIGSKLTYLTEYQDLVGQRQEILVQQSRHGEAAAAIAVLAESRARAVAEYERALLDELSKAEQKVAALAQEVIKAEQRTSLQRLKAPIDGVVQQLAVHTIGGVVTPAQTLMLIVPADGGLEIEAMVSNRDIGFVRVGQEAQVKVDTFNFTRYGLLHGKIVNISQDAITQDKQADGARAQNHKNEDRTQGLTYAARISLNRTHMMIEDKRINLSSGMATTAEIKTGSRRIISYLMSPLVRYGHDALRER